MPKTVDTEYKIQVEDTTASVEREFVCLQLPKKFHPFQSAQRIWLVRISFSCTFTNFFLSRSRILCY